MSSKKVFLAIASGIISLAVKKALTDIGITNILQFYNCENLIEQVYCYKPAPDLIITETFSQDDMDGFEAANLICKKCTVPFIFLSSIPENHINNKFLLCNSKIIQMPFEENNLLKVVNEILKPSEEGLN